MARKRNLQPLKLTDANPFESLGSLMSAIAVEAQPTQNDARHVYEAVIQAYDLDPIEIREDAISLFREGENILRLPFLSEHEAVVKSLRQYFFEIREVFYPLVFTSDSIQPYHNFIATWSNSQWDILSQSIKSFRLLNQNYELIELITRYLTALRGLLNETEKSDAVSEALNILSDMLHSIDEDIWKLSWEDYAEEFDRLGWLLQTESEKNPDSPISSFFGATKKVMWDVFTRANQTMDAVLFLPRAYAVFNIALAVSSSALPSESQEVVKQFTDLITHNELSSPKATGEISDGDSISPSTLPEGETSHELD